jgi:hypothetical protein
MKDDANPLYVISSFLAGALLANIITFNNNAHNNSEPNEIEEKNKNNCNESAIEFSQNGTSANCIETEKGVFKVELAP